MKIGIIGSGVVGQQLGIGFAKLGHDVKIGTRDTSKLADWIKTAGGKGSAGSVLEAAQFGEILVLATKWQGTEIVLQSLPVDSYNGKIVIDVTNPLDSSQGGVPRLDATEDLPGGLKVQNYLPEAKVVKAFNTISAYIMINAPREEGVPDLFIAGNDADAKKVVAGFATQWGWGSVIDLGDIKSSFWLETFAMLWIQFGFRNNNWTHAFKLLRK